jgi:hypothetical protein
MQKEKILLVGDLNNYTRSYQRYRTFIALGVDIHYVSTVPIPWRAGIDRPSFLSRIFWKLGFPFDPSGANKEILIFLKKYSPNIVWIEQGVTIRPKTLRTIKNIAPGVKIISLSEDDMYPPHNRSFYYTKGLPYYDLVFTTKPYNLLELRSLGAKKTELFLDSYNEEIHTPLSLSKEEQEKFSCDVGFCGAFEEDRAGRMLFLAENGVRVVVWGNGWASWVGRHKNLIVKNEHLFGIDYTKAINATKINLCFLRKLNRDEITSRSAEIPACGGFLLGERTERQTNFLEEGKEAEFFDSNKEMLEKVCYYLAHDDERRVIAEKGRERCIKSGYSQRAQVQKMFLIIANCTK